MNVAGTLKIVGNSSSEATVNMFNTRGHQINITTGTIEAKYYSISDLADAGLNVQATATLHATNNFSEGTWSNIQNNLNACYLNLETNNYAGGTIDNILFNATFTPGAGRYNVKRVAATVPAFIEFGGNIRGPIGGYLYELDNLAASATLGKLRWPPISLTNWTGAAGDENWHTAGNWDAGVPTPILDAVIPAGRPNYPNIMTADAVCRI
jgi:hypothetical protein